MTSTTSPCRRSTVVIISHAYSEPSLQAQIEAIGEFVDVELVAPRRGPSLVFEDLQTHQSETGITRTYKQLFVYQAQYLLLSPTLGLRSRPDIVHIDYEPWSLVFWQASLCMLFWSRSSLLVIGSKKNTYRRYRRLFGRLKSVSARIGYKKARVIVAASEKTKAMLVRELGVPDDKVAVQTHVGVDPTVFEPARRASTTAGVTVGFCGQLATHKGVEDLLRAVEKVRSDGKDVRLELLGCGPLEESLRERSRTVEWLRVHPAVPTRRVADFMRGLDIYALPARRLADHEEHDAHALIQAMSCGLPAVASNSGIIPEIVSDGRTGVIVEAGDETDLARGIGALHDSLVMRTKIGSAARTEVVRRFGLRTIAESRADLYTSLLRRRTQVT